MEIDLTKLNIVDKESAKFPLWMIRAETEKIDRHFKNCLVMLRKKKYEDFNREWGVWGLVYIRWIRQKVIETENQFVKYLYAYWHNRNSVLTLHAMTRLGKVGEKKKLEKSGKLYLDLIYERRTTADPLGVIKQVDGYLKKIRNGVISHEPVATTPPTKKVRPKKGEEGSSTPDSKQESN